MNLRRQIHRLFSSRWIAASAVATLGSLGSPVLDAAPAGGVVTSGAAVINAQGDATTIRQSTARVVIDWQSFSIGPRESVRFDQPSVSAIALNRVLGNERSLIEGALSANGRIFLVNSNGVLFTRGSSVNAAGLLVSSLDLADADFNAGRYVFNGSSRSGDIVNQGDLRAAPGGYVVLLGGAVSNQGHLEAERGSVVLGGGERMTLNLSDGSGVIITVDQGRLNALVENRQAIVADGGEVILTARAADELLAAQVNNSGVIQARTLDDLTGRITLWADGGSTRVGGTLDASAPAAGNGGVIDTSGNRVSVEDGALVTTAAASGMTGTWRIDPDGFTIAASGGDISGGELASQLAHNNVTLTSTAGSGSDGSIHVRDAVTWAADTQLELDATQDIDVAAAVTASGNTARLTLNAGHDINIAAPVSMTGSDAALALNFGGYASSGTVEPGTDYHINNLSAGTDGAVQIGDAAVTLSGNDASLLINGTPYTLIHSMAQLAAISAPVLDAGGNIVLSDDTGRLEFSPATGNYALAQDLDAAGTLYPYPVVNKLIGNLAGLGHVIRRLTVNVASADPKYQQFEDAGLIGTLGSGEDSGSRVRDLRLVDAFIADGDDVSVSGSAAALVVTNFGTVDNVYVNAYVRGTQPVGGVVGFNMPGATVSRAYADITIAAHAAGTAVGGLVGDNFGIIDQSSARGSIDASGIDLHDGGGLVVSSGIGGLVGQNLGGTVSASSADVDVTTTNSLQVGGLVGLNFWGSTISDSHATGAVNVTWNNALLQGQSYGGLVGDNSGSIIGSTASGNVTVAAIGNDSQFVTDIGGLVGTNEVDLFGFGGTIVDSSASGNVAISGFGYSVGGAVGNNFFGALSGVSASGNVDGGAVSDGVGGLIGNNAGAISQSSASGAVSGGTHVGALAGYNSSFGSIDGSRATGFVDGGALVGSNDGALSDSSYEDGGAVSRAQLLRAQLQSAIAQATADETIAATAPGVTPQAQVTTAEALDAHIQLPAGDYSVDVKSLSVDGVQFDLEESGEHRTATPSEPDESR